MKIKARRWPRYCQGLRPSWASTNHQRAHMIYTEAQTLDEALDIIQSRKRKLTRKCREGVRDAERALIPKNKVTITLPSLKFMDHGKK